ARGYRNECIYQSDHWLPWMSPVYAGRYTPF
ncbi:hypothetical protein EVA_22562, partial [gut metagenome]